MNAVQDAIVKEIEIKAPIDKVWDAITMPEHLGAWFGDSGATVDFRVGGEMALTWQEHGTGWAVIDAIEPKTRFVWRWARTSEKKPTPGDQTTVEFTLAESGDGTLLRVVESGFTSLAMDEATQAAARDENVGGWDWEIGELKDYVEADKV
jgi:uncharacterized protein YndB with AHSA1/START domain